MRHHHMRRQADHLAEEKILLLLDGQLDSQKAGEMLIHLEQCQKCQAAIRRIQKGFLAFADYKQSVSLPAAGKPPKGWSEFPALLDRVTTNSGRRDRQKAS